MTSPAITVGPDATLIEAAKIMVSHRIGCLPVVNDELQVLGIITERSFFPSEKKLPFTNQNMAWILGEWIGNLTDLEKTVAEVRKLRVADAEVQRHTVKQETPLAEVADQLLHEAVHHLVVENDGKVIGVVSRRDLIKIFAGSA